jgi:hypothetical protein
LKACPVHGVANIQFTTKYRIIMPEAGIHERKNNFSGQRTQCQFQVQSEREATLRRQFPWHGLGTPYTGFPSCGGNRADLHVLDEVQEERGTAKKDEKETGFRAVWL